MKTKRIVAVILVFLIIFANGFTSYLKPGGFLGIKEVYAADTSGDNVTLTAHFDMGDGTYPTIFKGKTGDKEKVLYLTMTNGNSDPMTNGKITIKSIRQPVDINMGTISTVDDSIVASKTTDKTSYTDLERPNATATLTLRSLNNNETKQIAVGFDQLSTNPNFQFMIDLAYLKKDVTFVLTGKVNGMDIQKTVALNFDFTGKLELSRLDPDIVMKYVDKTTGVIRTRQRFYAPVTTNSTNQGRLGVKKYVSEIQLPKICGKYPAADKVSLNYAHQRVSGAQIHTYDAGTGKLVITAERSNGLGIPPDYVASSNNHQIFIVDVDAVYDDQYVIDNFKNTYEGQVTNYTITNKATADPLYNTSSVQPVPASATRNDNTRSVNMYNDIIPIQFFATPSYSPSLQQMWFDGKAQFWSYNYVRVHAAGVVDSVSANITKLRVTYKDINNNSKTRDLAKDEYNIRYVEFYKDGSTSTNPFGTGEMLGPSGYVNLYYTNAGGTRELLKKFDSTSFTPGSASPFPRSETLGQGLWKNDLNLPVNDLSWETSAPQGQNSNRNVYMLMVVYETTTKLIENIKTETGATEQSFMNGGKGAITTFNDYRTNKVRWMGDTNYTTVQTDQVVTRAPLKGGLSTQQTFPDSSKNTVAGPTTSSDVLIAIRLPVGSVPLYSQNPTLYLPFPVETVVESVKLNTTYVSSQRYDNVQLSTFAATNAAGETTTVAKIKTGDLFYDPTGYATPRYIYLDVKLKTASNAPVGKTDKQLFVYGTSQDGYYYYSGTDVWDLNQDGSKTDTIFRSHDSHSPNMAIINNGSLFPELYINHENDRFSYPNVANISRTKTFNLTAKLTNRLSGIKAKNAKLLVRLPFIGNRDVKTDDNMDSTFSPVLSDTGVVLPSMYTDGEVYYTTVEKPTNNESDPASGWTTMLPSDLSTVKNVLIDLGSYELLTYTGGTNSIPQNVPGMVVVEIPIKIPSDAPMGEMAYAQMQADYTLAPATGIGQETPITSYTNYPTVKVKRDTVIKVKTIVLNENLDEMSSVPGYNLLRTNVKNISDSSEYVFMTATADLASTNANVEEKNDVSLGTYQITFPQAVLDFKDYVVTADGTVLNETAPGNRTYQFVISDTEPNKEIVITRTYVPEPVPSLTKPTVTYADTTLLMPNGKAKYNTGTNSTTITIDNIGNDSMVTPAENVTYTLLNNNGLHIDSVTFPAVSNPPVGVTVTLEGYKNAETGGEPAVKVGPVSLGSAQTLNMPNYGSSEADYLQVVKVVFDKLPIDTVFDGVTLNVRAKNRVTTDTNFNVRVDASGKYKLKNGSMASIDNTNYQTIESFITKAMMGSVNLQFKHGNSEVQASEILEGGMYEQFTAPTPPVIAGYKFKEITPPSPLPQIDSVECYDATENKGYYKDSPYTLVYEYLPVFPLDVVIYGDIDKSNSYNTGDNLLNGFTVKLYKSDDLTTPIDTKVTGVAGKVSFTDLYEGSYVYKVENCDVVNYRLFTGDSLEKSVTINGTTTTQYIRFEFIPIPLPTLGALTITNASNDLTAPNDLAHYPDSTKPNHTTVTLDDFKNSGNVDLTDVTYTLKFDGKTSPLSLNWQGYPTDISGGEVKFTVNFSNGEERIYGPIAVTQGQTIDFTDVEESVTVDQIQVLFTKMTPGTNYNGVTLDVSAVQKTSANTTSTLTVSQTGYYASRDGTTKETLAVATQQKTMNIYAVTGELVVNYVKLGMPIHTADTQTSRFGDTFTVTPPNIAGYTYFRTTVSNPLIINGTKYYYSNYTGRFSDATVTVNHEYIVSSSNIVVNIYNGDKANNNVLNQYEINNIGINTPYTLSNIPVISGYSHDYTHFDNKLTSVAGESPRVIDVIMKDERKTVDVEIVKDNGTPVPFKTYRLSTGNNLNFIGPDLSGFKFTGYTIDDGVLNPLQNRVVYVPNISNDMALKLNYETYQAPVEPEQKRDLIIRYINQDSQTTIFEYQVYDLTVGLTFTHLIQDVANIGYVYAGETLETSISQTIVSDADNIMTVPCRPIVAGVKIRYLNETTQDSIKAEETVQASINTAFVAEDKEISGYYCINTGESLIVQQDSAQNVLTLLYAPIPSNNPDTSGSALVVRHMLSSRGVTRTLRTEMFSLDGTEALPSYANLDTDEYLFTYEPFNSSVSANLLAEGYNLRNNSSVTRHVVVDGNVINIVYLSAPTEIRVQYYVEGTTDEVTQSVIDNTHSVGDYFIPPIPQKAGYRIIQAVSPIQLDLGTNEMTVYYEPIELSGVIKYLNKADDKVLQEESLPSSLTLGQLITHQAPTELTINQKKYVLAEGVNDTSNIMISEDSTENVIVFYYEPIELSGVIKYLNKADDKVLQEESLQSPLSLGQLIMYQAPTELTVNQKKYVLAEGISDTSSIRISKDSTKNVIIFYYTKLKKYESDDNDTYNSGDNRDDRELYGSNPSPSPTPMPTPSPAPSPDPTPISNAIPEEKQGSGSNNYSWETFKKPEEIFLDGELIPLSGLVFNGPYLNGYPDKTIHPDGNLTRAEAAQIIYNLYGRPDQFVNMEDNLPYEDVGNDAWYAKAIVFLTQYEIATGYPDGLFYPNKTITRAELVTLLAKYKNIADSTANEVIFKDVEGHWAKPQINAAKKDNIITGFADRTFKPNDLVTRSEAVTIINKMLKRPEQWIGEDEYTDLKVQNWAYKQLMNAINGYAED